MGHSRIMAVIALIVAVPTVADWGFISTVTKPEEGIIHSADITRDTKYKADQTEVVVVERIDKDTIKLGIGTKLQLAMTPNEKGELSATSLLGYPGCVITLQPKTSVDWNKMTLSPKGDKLVKFALDKRDDKVVISKIIDGTLAFARPSERGKIVRGTFHEIDGRVVEEIAEPNQTVESSITKSAKIAVVPLCLGDVGEQINNVAISVAERLTRELGESFQTTPQIVIKEVLAKAGLDYNNITGKGYKDIIAALPGHDFVVFIGPNPGKKGWFPWIVARTSDMAGTSGLTYLDADPKSTDTILEAQEVLDIVTEIDLKAGEKCNQVATDKVVQRTFDIGSDIRGVFVGLLKGGDEAKLDTVKSMNANTVVIDRPISKEMLNEIQRRGLKAIIGFNDEDITSGYYLSYVFAIAEHPSVLSWYLGQYDENSRKKIQQAAENIHNLQKIHPELRDLPITVSCQTIPSSDVLRTCKDIDVYMVAYSDGSLLSDWQKQSIGKLFLLLTNNPDQLSLKTSCSGVILQHLPRDAGAVQTVSKPAQPQPVKIDQQLYTEFENACRGTLQHDGFLLDPETKKPLPMYVTTLEKPPVKDRQQSITDKVSTGMTRAQVRQTIGWPDDYFLKISAGPNPNNLQDDIVQEVWQYGKDMLWFDQKNDRLERIESPQQ